MKKILIVICVFFSLFLTGCNSVEEEFDIIENNIKSSIPESIEGDIVLPTEDLTYNATISWKSSNEDLLTSVGENKNKLLKTDVTLTYTIIIKNKQREGTIVVEVNANKYLLQLDRVESLMLDKIPEVVSEDLNLPKENPSYKAQIEWNSSNEEILTVEGVNKNQTSEIIDVTLSYKITIDGYVREGEKQVKVSENKITADLNAVEEIIKKSIPQTTVEDITLITEVYSMNAKITWESSNEKVLDLDGVVTNYNKNPIPVTLTYTITINNEKRLGEIIVEVLYTEDYTFELKEKEIYIGIDHYLELEGIIYKKGKVYSKVKSGIKIEGEYDKKVPSKYELIAYVEIDVDRENELGNKFTERIKLTDTFTLYVLGINDVTFEEINEYSFNSVEYSFGIGNYYIICNDGNLNIIDLDKPSQYQYVRISGRCNSYYYKDGYLYISSVDPYEDEYSDNFTGYITKIDLENIIKDEEVKVNCAPDSIVVDKRNNVIISKEQNQHIDIEYLDMNTKTLSTFCKGYYGDKLIYNEEEDIVLVVSTKNTGTPIAYKYNNQTKTYEEVEKSYELESTAHIPMVFGRYYNAFIFGDRLNKKEYAEFVNEEIITKEIPLPYQFLTFDATHQVSINSESYGVLQYSMGICYVTVCDKVSNEYQVYNLTNYNNNEINSLHLYDNKIYMFDSKLGKLYIVE